MPTATLQLTTKDAKSTDALAAALAAQCDSGDCILLKGDLGTGKTTFARGFIRALQQEKEEVVSPTFTLVQTYPARKKRTLWHFDLYRLRTAQEALEIGMDEALADGITLIEWPELLEERLPHRALEVRMAYGDAPDARKLSFSGESGLWRPRLAALEKAHYS